MKFRDRVREEWPEVADQIFALIDGKVRPWEIDDSISAWTSYQGRWTTRREQRICDKLKAMSKLIEGFGTEAIFDSGASWPDMEYVNMGDTYNTTILFDFVEDRYMVTTWGDWIEHAEAKGRTYP